MALHSLSTETVNKTWNQYSKTYHNDPNFSDTQIWANSADPDKTIWVFTFCYFISIILTKYPKVDVFVWILGRLQQRFLVSQNLGTSCYSVFCNDLNCYQEFGRISGTSEFCNSIKWHHNIKWGITTESRDTHAPMREQLTCHMLSHTSGVPLYSLSQYLVANILHFHLSAGLSFWNIRQ